jgi:NADPH:quinone reductase-like Zn-dependent oxidoreductase
MKAIVFEKYGPPEVLKIMDIEKPVPKDNEILIKVIASTVSTGDWRMRKPDPMLARLVNGLLKPKKIKILGFELAGIVEAVGKGVARFNKGDEVFAFTGFKFGAYAEYICMSEVTAPKNGMVELKPKNMTFEQAAALPGGGLTALVFARTAQIKSGQKVLIHGASGNVGSYALQIAKHIGAQVTGVTSTTNLEMIKSLGADYVIDYKKHDFTQSGEKYNIVFDAVGKLSPSNAKKALSSDGHFFSVMKSGELKLGDLLHLKELVEEGAVQPFIDRIYRMEQIIEAHRYAELGHKRANIVIKIAE